jgi:hypothetical protein
MEVHPELRRIVGTLDLKPESRDLILAALIGQKRSLTPNDALMLLRLVSNLRSGGFMGLIPLQKTQWLENVVTLIRQGHQEWVSRVCYVLYEDHSLPQGESSLLPKGMMVDLLRWVNDEKAEKVRESLWAILLRKDVGLASVAETADVAAGLCEQNPITRNNVIRFLSEHFSPDQVVDSLFRYSMSSGRRIPSVVFKRYVGVLRDQEHLQQKKYILKNLLGSAWLDDKEIDQMFSDYMDSLNRFDLIRLFSAAGGHLSRIAALKRKGRQMGFQFERRNSNTPHHDSFGQRVHLLRQL